MIHSARGRDELFSTEISQKIAEVYITPFGNLDPFQTYVRYLEYMIFSKIVQKTYQIWKIEKDGNCIKYVAWIDFNGKKYVWPGQKRDIINKCRYLTKSVNKELTYRRKQTAD